MAENKKKEVQDIRPVDKEIDEKINDILKNYNEQEDVKKQLAQTHHKKSFWEKLAGFVQGIIQMPAEILAYVIMSIKMALTYKPKVEDQKKDLKDQVKADSSYNQNRSKVIRDRDEIKQAQEKKDPRYEKTLGMPRFNKYIDEYFGKVPNSQIFEYMRTLANAGERMLPDEMAKCMGLGLGTDYKVSYMKGEFKIEHSLGGIVTLNDKLDLVKEKSNASARVCEYVCSSCKGFEDLNTLSQHNKLNEEALKMLKTFNLTFYEVKKNDLGIAKNGELQLDYKSVKKYLMERDGKLEKSVAALLKADMNKNKVPSKAERLAKAEAEFVQSTNKINRQRIYESEPTTAFDAYEKHIENGEKVSVDEYLKTLKEKKAVLTPKNFAAFMDYKYGDKVSIEYQPENNCYSVFELSNASKNEEGLYVNAEKFKVNTDGAVRVSDLDKLKKNPALEKLSEDIERTISQFGSMVQYNDKKQSIAGRISSMIDNITGSSPEKRLQKKIESVEKEYKATAKKEETVARPETIWVKPEEAIKPEPRRSPEYNDRQVFHSDIGDDVLGDDDYTPSKTEDKNFGIGDAVLGNDSVEWDDFFNDPDDKDKEVASQTRDDDEWDR